MIAPHKLRKSCHTCCLLFLLREAQRQQRRTKQAAARQEVVASKLSAAAEAEAATMAQFRAIVQASGGNLTIPKRQG